MSTAEDLELLERQSQRTREEALALGNMELAEDTASRMNSFSKREDLMLKTLKVREKREETLWQHIAAINRSAEEQFLEIQVAMKKREEDLLKEHDRLLQERDGLKAELVAVCNSAISRQKWLEANIESRDKQHKEVENDLVSRLAVEEAESERMRKALWSLVTPRDAKIESLQAKIAEMTVVEQKQAVEMAEKDDTCEEVFGSISSMNSSLKWHVGFFHEALQSFKDMMLPWSRKSWPSHEEVGTVARTLHKKSTQPATSHEHENAELQGLRILESEVAALLRELFDTLFAMNQATQTWVGRPLIQVVERCDLHVLPLRSVEPAPDTVMEAEPSLQRSEDPSGSSAVPASAVVIS